MTRPRSLIAWLAALAFLLAAGPFTLAQAPLPAQAGTYRISGMAVDARSGAKLARCSVQIADVKDRGDRGQPREVLSGDDGVFTFSGLPSGKYSLWAERRGYLAQSFEQHEQYSTAIAVGPGLDSENLLFKLTAEAMIEGTVTDEAGEAVRGAQVRLFRDEDSNGIRSTQQRDGAITDDLGAYELRGLRPGAFFLVVTAHPWYAQHLSGVSTQTVDGNQEAAEAASQSRALDVAYPVTYYPGVTDQDSATPIPVKGGDRLEANLTLAAQPAMHLRIKLPDSGNSENGEPRNHNFSVMLTHSVFGQAEAMNTQFSSVDGSLDIEGILPGHYDVTLNGFTPGEGRGVASTHFEADINSGTTELSPDDAQQGVIVTGKVTAQGKLPPNSGISLRIPNVRRQQYGALSEAGEFSIDTPPGSYEILGNINGMHIASIRATGASVTGRTLTIKAGDSPKLTIVADDGHGEIEGVALRAGKPASGVMVLLAPEDPKDNQVLFRRDQSDSDGTFTLANIFPGHYRLLAIEDGWDLEWANPAVLQAFLAKSVPIEIKSGDHLKQSIEIQPR